MKKIIINQKKWCIYCCLLIFLILLVVGCSKGTNQNNIDAKTEITGSVIEDSKENCRLNNESDCRPIEIKRGEQENEESNNAESANLDNNTKKIINASREVLLSNCESGWKCVERDYRAYQYANCSWISVEHCVYGCKNGTCNPPTICKQNSLKCDKDNVVKCTDGYEWNLNESCDYQCENGICIGGNDTIQANTTNSTNSTLEHNFISDNCINVLNFNYAPAGNNLSDEYFTLKNTCSYSINMTNWIAKDSSTHDFRFSSFNLGYNAEVTVHTGSGTDDSANLYWNMSIHIWNNDKDTLYINISNGTSVFVCRYNLTNPPCI